MFNKLFFAFFVTATVSSFAHGFTEQEAHQIKVWDAHTAEGTELGSLPENDISEDGQDLADVDALGVSALIHKASLQCSVLHVTVNENAKPQTMTATCDGTPVFGPVLTSTGKGGATPNGTFTVYNKVFMAYSGAYNNAPMARFLVFRSCGKNRPNCIGIHATVKSNYGKLGSPASHGCVRLTMENAVKLWNLSNASGTTKVTVK